MSVIDGGYSARPSRVSSRTPQVQIDVKCGAAQLGTHVAK